MTRDRNLIFVLIACLALALPACQPETPAETPETSGARQQAESLAITEIIIAGPTPDPAAFRPMTPDDPIQVTLRTTGRTEGADLLVKVFALANGTAVGNEAIRLDADSEPEQSIRFERETPWDPGRYLIEVTLDGKLAGHQELDIHPEAPAPAQ